MTKLELARQAFESLKSQGLKVSKASVAKLANVSRSLLTPGPGGKYKSGWGTLAIDIDAYQLINKPSNKSDRYRCKLQELRKARDEIERKYHAQVQQVTELHAEIVELRNESINYKKAYDNLIAENDKLKKYRSTTSLVNKPGQLKQDNISPISAQVTISPDDELVQIKGGKYEWDQLAARQAHTFARQRLLNVLSRPIKKRLFVPIGRPGSGKTHWCNSGKPPQGGRLSVFYDATNSTIADRWELLNIAKNSADTIVCYVYFDIKLQTCIENIRKRKDRAVPDHVVSNMSVDPPELSEGFDELIIVRN